ncbi:maltose alpha-D-glucosyltransferase [Chloroflexota bacterium]
MAKRSARATRIEGDPLWYKDAIIYELHVRAFLDSDGDGIGDFRGLTEKLDYLHDLGVTAIWLLPFYPSPLKDDGYDIADFREVHNDYGTLHDFKLFLKETNRRGLRVITELVLNHTSEQHPWFQRARQSTPGSKFRDFYVWNDTPDRYKEARIIFKDFEYTNWAWDPVAQAYYWHRFYSNQPDLNYDNPLVRRAIYQVLDFWLRMGVDGLRLDAVPYLYERDGTNCENLPETHTFLSEMRNHVDSLFKDRMLLAEANQWPEDAVAYFGSGDECHMAFHFPLMPRLFMAIRMEDRFPIVDILDQTPAIPEACQWVTFLRNHDELTLEMVTDEERDYMYRAYAHESRMRINLGIRRRLAPLLNNDRRKIELMNALLFSLPGTPVIYYGDEIGMGDNFYLGDRNGVRTPMQWSADRNAGFSRANSQKLYLPIIIDPEYHYEAVNVDAQQGNPDSLLWWMKRIIAARKRLKSLSRGSLEFINSDNPRVLVFIRRYQSEITLVVANLSRLSQHASIDLSEFEGRMLVEVFGRTNFPPIGEKPYMFLLNPYAFYWFSLEPLSLLESSSQDAPIEGAMPTITVRGTWENLFKKSNKTVLEEVLINYIKKCRWFGGKARKIQSFEVQDIIPIPYAAVTAYLVLFRIEYIEGEAEMYLVPLTFVPGEQQENLMEESSQFVIAYLELIGKAEGTGGLLYDAMADRNFCDTLLKSISRRRRFNGDVGELLAWPTQAFRKIRGSSQISLDSALSKAEQSNTSVIFGDRLILKLYRRLGEGRNPELEIGHFLTEKASFPNTSPIAGAIEYQQDKHGAAMTMGVLQGYIKNHGDAWNYTLHSLGQYYEQILAHPELQAPPLVSQSLIALIDEDTPLTAEETAGHYLSSARLLGQRTAELHLTLASAIDDPNLVPEPSSLIYQRSLYQSMRSLSVQVMQLLRYRVRGLSGETREDAQRVLDRERDIMQYFQSIRQRKITGMRIRCHGDYHLGQVLYTGNDFVIIDFEGEPARPLSERRLKRSPLRDVAAMIRSFHYSAYMALLGQAPTALRIEDLPILEKWAQLWYLWVSSAFLRTYLEVVEGFPLLPESREDLKILLDAYLMDKAVYEVGYELNNRPDWTRIPLKGILQMLEVE